MSAAPRPGWYPDPAGTPDLYRWWDGADWTAAISESPRAPTPRLHSPARPEDDVTRRRPSPFRTVVALLVCLALFLSATVGLGLAIWGDRSGVQRGARSPGAATPAAAPASSAAVGRLDQSSRVATVGPVSMTLPDAPYRTRPDPMSIPQLLDACFLAWAPVHTRSHGATSWAAAVLLGRLHPDVGAGGDLAARGRAVTAQLDRLLFRSAPVQVTGVEVADHAVDNHAGVLVTARVHYRLPDLPSRYDDVAVVLVGLEDGSVVLAATSVPDDADPGLARQAADALASLAVS
ncbi:Protein of unknown function [Friedmanniella luteola]|uniref:DUF2510 domain-containing protein n=1 Tax=Friedmanniella luteola TaxID=546871 RepID=A0A1H1P3G7_9ACTN|nr:DUF2510 domain-containing protein [Friedmanniella luteola]SDS05723.1 Protein of unknown function [Friedmanniella luteola]